LLLEGAGSFFITISILAQGPILLCPADIECCFPGVKLPRCEADNSPPSIAEDKNVWSSVSILPYVFVVWYLIKLWNMSSMVWFLIRHRFNFTFISVNFVNETPAVWPLFFVYPANREHFSSNCGLFCRILLYAELSSADLFTLSWMLFHVLLMPF
jgi:hypothetical protein